MFCSGAGDETGGWDLGEQKEKEKTEGTLPGFLACMSCKLEGKPDGFGG